jgi:hypothetical protein
MGRITRTGVPAVTPEMEAIAENADASLGFGDAHRVAVGDGDGGRATDLGMAGDAAVGQEFCVVGVP